ncbi:sugar ABC transporter ATP-binding protein [Nonomuraea sp. NPDC049028]|uniref:sugar ABC transporter ATP-binding protein n=1 Tax=Nonomuraea sp. NPDC049028 TaxID=3364348 RepID=UPI00371938D4
MMTSHPLIPPHIPSAPPAAGFQPEPAQPTAPVLEARHVSKSFGEIVVLHDVSLSLDSGRVLGLVGQNGAGKSTLMKILNGQYPYGSYQGSVVIAGQEVRLRSPRDATRAGIGIVPQETSVIDTLSVGENIHLGQYGARRLLTVAQLQRRAQVFLDGIQLPLDARLPVASLTTSEKQLVMIARTVYARPRVLILDEPTTALTDTEAGRLFDVVRSLSGQGVSSILISHRLNEVFDLADDIAVLRDGRLVDELPRSSFDRGRIVTAIAGRRLDEPFPSRPTHVPTAAGLAVRDLTVPDPRRPDRLAVNSVSFSAAAGEIIGIGGPMGSGRSELLEAIYGLLPARSGHIDVHGRAFTPQNPKASISHGIAFVPEDRKSDGLFLNGSVEDNLTLAILRTLSSRLLLRPAARHDTAARLIDQFKVKTDQGTAPITSLSGGNQQKVLIARALAARPSVLLLDEPSKGVDVGARAEIYRLIRQAASDGVAIVVVSSEVPELLGLCDRVIVLSKGSVVSELDARTTTPEDLTLAAMSGTLNARTTPETPQ